MTMALSKWEVWAPNNDQPGVEIIDDTGITLKLIGGSLLFVDKNGGIRHIYSSIGYTRCFYRKREKGDTYDSWNVLATSGMKRESNVSKINASYLEINANDGTATFFISDTHGRNPIEFFSPTGYTHITYEGPAVDE